MGLSLRLLVLDQTDRIYRLEVNRFERMRNTPKACPLPQFAGQRVRGAEAVVELDRRAPIRIVRMTVLVFTFDREGCLDTEVFERQHFGRFASRNPLRGQLALDSGSPAASQVVDARYLFDDRGGRWEPSVPLLRAMEDAFLGKVSVPRL